VLLLGDPVGHSLSAAFQNAGFGAAGIAAVYLPRQVSPADLPQVLDEIRRDPDVLGANVTIPHKITVASLLDGLGPDVRQLGAVNTLSHRGQVLVGWNTDRTGFAQALEDAGFDPSRRAALVLGAGGAARAVVDVLRPTASRVWVAARNLEQARRLCRDLNVEAGGPTPLGSLKLVVGRVDLIVNATPVGMDGHSLVFPADWLGADHFVFDLLYNPPLTPLVRAARDHGARAVNGLAMLLYQGLASFEIWTGRPAPEAAMRAALERAVLGSAAT
jgi:shikimate dehydrogenase